MGGSHSSGESFDSLEFAMAAGQISLHMKSALALVPSGSAEVKELKPSDVRWMQLLRSWAGLIGPTQGSSFLATLGWMIQSLRDWGQVFGRVGAARHRGTVGRGQAVPAPFRLSSLAWLLAVVALGVGGQGALAASRKVEIISYSGHEYERLTDWGRGNGLEVRWVKKDETLQLINHVTKILL